MDSRQQKLVNGEFEFYNRELRQREEQIFLLREDVHRLEKDAIVDRRTELFSRAFFCARLKEEIARSERYRHFLSLILLQLEAPALDSTQQMVQRVKQFGREISAGLTRRTDVIATLRRCQIAVILPETERVGAEVVLRRYLGLLDAKVQRVHSAIVTYPEDASNIEMVLGRLNEISEGLEGGHRRNEAPAD